MARIFPLIILCLLCGGCFLEPLPPASPAPTAGTASALPWTAADSAVRGLCFEAAADSASRVFVLRSVDDLSAFYTAADESGLCRHPVERAPFAFADGAVLAGLWSRGTGCTARHELLAAERDSAAKTLRLTLRFVTEGDCGYELVRPFWIALPAFADWAVDIRVE